MGSYQKDVTEKVKKISEGVLSRAVDAVLVSLFFGFEFGLSGYGETYKASEKAQNALAELNYATIKRSLSNLRRKGLIRGIQEKLLLPEITEEGRKRVGSLLPFYDNKRIWDRQIYLVTYDIPRKRNKDRNLLRGFLKRIGCGMLQESVWLTPYNPKNLIEEFVDAHKLGGEMIIVSSVGKDGTVGNMELPELMDEVFKLTKINARYGEFLKLIKTEKFTKDRIVFSYLSILRDDPQLPFEFLPEDWLGDKAYKKFKDCLG